MPLLTRDVLLERTELAIEKVELENGDHVFVREMVGGERDRFEQSLVREVKKKGKTEYVNASEHFRAKLVVHVICDETGKNLLAANDYLTLSQNMGIHTLEKIVNVAQRLNKISDEDREDLEKNSESGPSEDSTSDSPES